MDESLKSKEIMEATIERIHHLMEEGELTCRELVEFYLKRIEAYDQKGPKINSIIKINPDALKIADELDAKYEKTGLTGSLHGIPVLLKDNVDTKDMETTAGSLSLEESIPKEDAFITKRMKEAGAIIIAKVNLHEFAVWGETVSSVLGQTLNPYDLTRTPGGSSGGTGASVASNFGMVGIGTDTINSVRSPASACSLVGFRPTVGLISKTGIVPYSFTQDTAGPICRSVEDAVKLLDVIRGYDPKDRATAGAREMQTGYFAKHLKRDGLKKKRIGVLRSFFGKEKVHAEVNEQINKRLEDIQKSGGVVVDLDESIDADQLIKEVSVHLYELKRELNEYLEALGEPAKVGSLKEIIDSGKFHKGIEENIKIAQDLSTDTPEYHNRLKKRKQLRNQVVEIMEKNQLDAIVYPHQKRPVVKVGESQVDRNGVIGSVTGFPSCVVPGGFTSATAEAPGGIPVGIEFLTREWDEATLIEIVYGFEQNTLCRKSPMEVPAVES
ncbi:amidase family protein [Isachenkonia alkalipeptolytica]|uniref:Amidase n=1 Tax=Isachenkonia alkalipeptolytica TaxID=2565777 RepID=A0AA44BER6_9CLOT|nr:amidase family protein [Isachenkonia alkalipeptolytica]NBG89248.1 amidase [Isachenkonia alkalipeptolytica]